MAGNQEKQVFDGTLTFPVACDNEERARSMEEIFFRSSCSSENEIIYETNRLALEIKYSCYMTSSLEHKSVVAVIYFTNSRRKSYAILSSRSNRRSENYIIPPTKTGPSFPFRCKPRILSRRWLRLPGCFKQISSTFPRGKSLKIFAASEPMKRAEVDNFFLLLERSVRRENSLLATYIETLIQELCLEGIILYPKIDKLYWL